MARLCADGDDPLDPLTTPPLCDEGLISVDRSGVERVCREPCGFQNEPLCPGEPPILLYPYTVRIHGVYAHEYSTLRCSPVLVSMLRNLAAVEEGFLVHCT